MKHESHETRALDPGLVAGLAPGMVLRGRYRLESVLGRGGMGVVFKAVDTELQRAVAVKVLPEAASDPEAKQRLLAEARAAAALNHPHVVAVHDVGEDRGIPFFVMELVPGKSLGHERLGDLKHVTALGGQICDALEHAHANNLVHRDLKPENVLLVEESAPPSIKLADLGLAVSTRGGGAPLIAGTVAYMAPEQAMGRAVDGRADLYSLGVMLYEMTTGRLPFAGDDVLSVISQHVHAPVVPPRAHRSELPASLESVILRLLSKEPGERYARASDAARAIAGVWSSPDVQEGGAAVALLDALSRGRLIGRGDELTEARELWRRSMGGQSHCVLLSGEPGAGKTRLAREIVIQASVDGAVVLSGGCYEYEATTPYLPFVESFRRWAQERENPELADVLGASAPWLAKLAPEIETRLGPFPERAALPPHEERLLFFDAVSRVLAEMARRSGVLVYLDDLHWADTSTLGLLGYLLRDLKDKRVLFLSAYRETELDRAHPLAKALVDWNRERLSTRIALKRFGLEETRSQLAALLAEDVSDEFAGAVFRETEGNPFFVEEVLKSLIDRGTMRREQGRWVRSDLKDLAIPQSVKEAIGTRLDKVSPEANEVLRAASVLGKVFSFDELQAADDRGEDALLDALDEAVAAQLLVAGAKDSFAFTHDKVREVLYEEMNPIRRRRLHKRIAEGLEARRGQMPVSVETLAHHFVEAADYEKGLSYAREAAKEAERIFAYHEAIEAYRRALECAEALLRGEEVASLEEAIGNAFIGGSDILQAAPHFERALAGAKDPRDRVRLQVRLAHSYVQVGDERGLHYVTEAQKMLDPVKDPLETANAISIEARFHHLAGRHRRAAELLLDAVELASPPPDTERITGYQAGILSPILAYLAGAHQHLGRFVDGDRWAREAIAFGKRFGYPAAEAVGLEFLGEHCINRGDWTEGIGYAEQEREIALRIQSRERHAWTTLVAGVCSQALGDLARAEREYLDGIAIADSIGERRLAPLLRCYLAETLVMSGRVVEALAQAQETLTEAESTGLLYLRTEARRALAGVRLRRGELEESVRLSEEVLDLTRDTESVVSRLWLGPVHVEALRRLERGGDARACLEEYALMVSGCQSPYFDREVLRLRKLVAG